MTTMVFFPLIWWESPSWIQLSNKFRNCLEFSEFCWKYLTIFQEVPCTSNLSCFPFLIIISNGDLWGRQWSAGFLLGGFGGHDSSLEISFFPNAIWLASNENYGILLIVGMICILSLFVMLESQIIYHPSLTCFIPFSRSRVSLPPI